VKKSAQLGAGDRLRCPPIGLVCFLCAFVTSLFGTRIASADTPPAAIQTASFAMPATVLGLSNPYVIAAAMESPEVLGFTLSQDIRAMVKRFDKLARYGVDLNQRKIAHTEKLQLRVRQRGPGGVIELRYRH
jgi:hypothetical protein